MKRWLRPDMTEKNVDWDKKKINKNLKPICIGKMQK